MSEAIQHQVRRRAFDTIVVDLDGTLVDSVYQHVVAWQAAFQDVGVLVAAADIHRAIGLGGDKIVASLVGEAVERAVGDQVRQGHETHFRPLMSLVRELHGASALLETLSRDHHVVVASTGDAETTDLLLSLVEARTEVTAVVTASDVEQTKPAPDLIGVAIERVNGTRALALGDSVWDGEAAARAGVTCLGFLSGGTPAQALLDAGMAKVYEGPNDLFNDLTSSATEAW